MAAGTISEQDISAGTVVSSCPIASGVGFRVLNEGGNAIDAAVATGLALAVTYPQAGNLGGGGFMMIHEHASGTDEFLDFRERAPAASSVSIYKEPEDSVIGGKGVGVPGTIAGFQAALEHYGTWSLEKLAGMVAELADVGHWLTRRQWKAYHAYKGLLSRFDETRRVFVPNGRSPQSGMRFRQPDLARALNRIAELGVDGFYRGEIAESIVKITRATGGVMTLEDMESYEVRWREPIFCNFGDSQLMTAPLPSAGGVLVRQVLRLMEESGLMDAPIHSPERLSYLARAFRVAFVTRSRALADPDYHSMDAESLDYIHRADLASLEALVAREQTATDLAQPGHTRSTTHFAVLDPDGNAVSCTYSLNTLFGSKLTVPGFGFLLNNSIDDFTINPELRNWYQLLDSPNNTIMPSRRPVSSMTPTIVLKDGEVQVLVGGAGGPMIPTLVTQFILNFLVHNESVSGAMRYPRIHHQFLPDTLYVEPDLPAETVTGLERMGHHLTFRTGLGIGAALARHNASATIRGTLDTRFMNY